MVPGPAVRSSGASRESGRRNVDLGACDITVLPPRALALCDGTARYTPKVGDRKERIETRRWTFHLIQDGQDWSIEDIDTR